MVITLILTILWLTVITIGVLSVVDYLKNKKKDKVYVLDCPVKEFEKLFTYGIISIAVGVVGLLMTAYMCFSGHHNGHSQDGMAGTPPGPQQNFGFRFY